jgi:hypothetical protein
MPLLADVSAGGQCLPLGMRFRAQRFFCIRTLRKQQFIADIQT